MALHACANAACRGLTDCLSLPRGEKSRNPGGPHVCRPLMLRNVLKRTCSVACACQLKTTLRAGGVELAMVAGRFGNNKRSTKRRRFSI